MGVRSEWACNWLFVLSVVCTMLCPLHYNNNHELTPFSLIHFHFQLETFAPISSTHLFFRYNRKHECILLHSRERETERTSLLSVMNTSANWRCVNSQLFGPSESVTFTNLKWYVIKTGLHLKRIITWRMCAFAQKSCMMLLLIFQPLTFSTAREGCYIPL